MKNNPERIVRQINQVYYMVYSATILSTLIGYYLTMNKETVPDPKSNFVISFSSFVILYVIASVPSSLAIFHKKLKKWQAIEDEYQKFKKYILGAQLRLAAVGIGLVLSVIAHFMLYAGTANLSMIFCAGIAAIALFFCKPTASKVAKELEIEEEE